MSYTLTQLNTTISFRYFLENNIFRFAKFKECSNLNVSGLAKKSYYEHLCLNFCNSLQNMEKE